MFRTFAITALSCCLAAAQVGVPRIGFVRLDDGTVRELRGVAGAFSTGEIVLRDVEQFYFDGTRGFAKSGSEITAIDSEGGVTGPADEMPALNDVARIEEDELVIVSSGVRLRLPFPATGIERAGADYLLLSGSDGRLLVRFKPGLEAIYQLPEPAE